MAEKSAGKPSEADAANITPMPAGTAPGTMPDPPVTALKAADRREYQEVLERSHAWQTLSQDVDLTFDKGMISGPEKGLRRQDAGRLLTLARNVLEANGYVVEGQYEPNLVIRVMGG